MLVKHRFELIHILLYTVIIVGAISIISFAKQGLCELDDPMKESLSCERSKEDLSFGVIGYGQFGKFIHQLIVRYLPQNPVFVFDQNKDDTEDPAHSLQQIAACKVVFLAVPISEYAPLLDELKHRIGADTIVVDVATVKVHTNRLLKESGLACGYIASHPMFGPESYRKMQEQVAGFRIVVTDHTLDQKIYSKMKAFFHRLGVRLIEISADQHDRDLAETLFLTHYIGQVVANAGFLRTEIDTVSFGFLMDAVDAVKNDSALFDQVVRFNPYCAQVIEKFDESDRKIRRKMLEQSAANRGEDIWYSY